MGTTSGLYRLNPSQRREEKGKEEEGGGEEVVNKEEEDEQKEEGVREMEEEEEEEEKYSAILVTMGSEAVQAVAWRSELQGPKGWSLGGHAFIFTNSSAQFPQDVSYSSIDGIHVSNATQKGFGVLVVATKEKLYFFNGVTWWFEWVSVWGVGLGGMVDSPPTALSFSSSGDLYIGTNSSISRLHINYTFQRLGPLEGLPSRPITALHYSPFFPEYPPPTEIPSPKSHLHPSFHGGIMLVGTARGYAVFDTNSSQFISYHYGHRWHPGEEVKGMAAAGGNTTLLLTDRGIAVVWPEQWTLAKKAVHYQTMLRRHQREPGQQLIIIVYN